MPRTKLVKKLTDKGFPKSSRYYKTAHEYADKAEKCKYPKGYEKLKKAERKMGKHEGMGKNLRSGKIEVERKFSKNKSEIALHERKEHAKILQLEHREAKRKSRCRK